MGRVVVARAVEAIERIESSSGKIGEIVGVIDEMPSRQICSRSMPLSKRRGLAMLERASPWSRPKLRSLAQRSAQAAKDIKGLISASNRC